MMTLGLTTVFARDLNEAWFLCVKEAWYNGREYTIQKGSFEGTKRLEIPLVYVEVNYPWTLPLSPIVPEGTPSVATEESIHEYMLYLMTASKKPGEDYTYGEDLEPQIPEVIRRYKEWGYDTNRLCMSVGSRDSIFQYRREETTGQRASSQCLRLVDTRIQDGTLHFIVYFRSWDLWAGFPVNMGGLQLLKKYMADEIGVTDGKLIAFSKGLHLYEHTFDLARVVLGVQ